MGIFVDKIGNKYGRLTVMSRAKNVGRHVSWNCECSCGNKTVVTSNNLLRKTKSCGCLMKERASISRKTHGMSGTRFYRIWTDIVTRTTNKNHHSYHYYGKRGIINEWSNFTSFKKEMYDSYLKHKRKKGEKNTTIDRIDPKEGYSKKNCRWATRQVQGRNRRNSLYVTFKGEKKTAKEWSKILNISYYTIRNRIKKGLKPREILWLNKSQ